MSTCLQSGLAVMLAMLSGGVELADGSTDNADPRHNAGRGAVYWTNCLNCHGAKVKVKVWSGDGQSYATAC